VGLWANRVNREPVPAKPLGGKTRRLFSITCQRGMSFYFSSLASHDACLSILHHGVWMIDRRVNAHPLGALSCAQYSTHMYNTVQYTFVIHASTRSDGGVVEGRECAWRRVFLLRISFFLLVQLGSLPFASPCARIPKITWLGRGRRNRLGFRRGRRNRLRFNLARFFALVLEAGARDNGGPSTEESSAGTDQCSQRSGHSKTDTSTHDGAVSSHRKI